MLSNWNNNNKKRVEVLRSLLFLSVSIVRIETLFDLKLSIHSEGERSLNKCYVVNSLEIINFTISTINSMFGRKKRRRKAKTKKKSMSYYAFNTNRTNPTFIFYDRIRLFGVNLPLDSHWNWIKKKKICESATMDWKIKNPYTLWCMEQDSKKTTRNWLLKLIKCLYMLYNNVTFFMLFSLLVLEFQPKYCYASAFKSCAIKNSYKSASLPF